MDAESGELKVSTSENQYAGTYAVSIGNLFEGYVLTGENPLMPIVHTITITIIAGEEVARPSFILEDYELEYNVPAGVSWSLNLPKTEHKEDLEMTLATFDRGQASSFLKYDGNAGTIFIKANATTVEDIGSYPIRL